MCIFNRNAALRYVMRNTLIYQCPGDIMTLAHIAEDGIILG